MTPDELLDQARLLVARIRDRFLASAARFKVALARHRLARNRWESDSLVSAAQEIETELILIDALEQPAEEIARRLIDLADRAKAYYPRVAFDALVFARTLGQVVDEATGIVRESERAIEEGAFLSNSLHDIQRAALYRAMSGATDDGVRR